MTTPKKINRLQISVATMLIITGVVIGIYFQPQLLKYVSKYTNFQSQTQTPQNTAPAIELPVMTIVPQKIQIWNEFSGRLAAVNAVEIKPQIRGKIDRIYFRDGQRVKKGALLMAIESRRYKAALKRAEASLEARKSDEEFARLELLRAKRLYTQKAISKRTLDTRRNQYHIAKSNTISADADLIEAKVNLDNSLIRAPISGIISRAEMTVGNIVEPGGSAPVLTSIVDIDTIYAEFEIDDQTYIKYVHNQTGEKSRVPVRLNLGSNGQVIEGSVHSFDNQINPSTGTIRARALFKNPRATLLPGMFTNLEMASPSRTPQIVIPKSAIGIDQNRRFVYKLNANNEATYTEVKLGQAEGNMQIITSGLKKGDVIILGGLSLIRPKTKINPVRSEERS